MPSPDTIALIVAVVTSTATGTWWLSRQFSKHEEKDNQRHIENLGKFGKLTLQIARLRWHMKIPDRDDEKLDANGNGS